MNTTLHDSDCAHGPAGRIDVHHHCTSPAFLKVMQGRRTGQASNMGWSVAGSLDAMEKGGVAKALASTCDPGVFFGDYDAAGALARECNEFYAKLRADHPGRFGFWATVPLPDIDGALKEAAYALDVLKADGVGLMTNYQGKYLGDAALTPFLEELNRRKAAVFVHPIAAPCCAGILPGIPDGVVEYQSDTSRTITSLVLNGVTVRHPEIRFVFSHGGGTIPYITARFEQVMNNRRIPGLEKLFPNGILAELQRLYFDTAQVYNPNALAALTRFMPSSQIVFGSDYPAAYPEATIKGLVDFGLSEADLHAIGRGNMIRMLPGLGA